MPHDSPSRTKPTGPQSCVLPLSSRLLGSAGPLARVLLERGLSPVFQPLVDLKEQSVYAHEALIRGPEGSRLHGAPALLRAASAESLEFDFECHCLASTLQHWGARRYPGRLFLNISANTLVRMVFVYGRDALVQTIVAAGVTPRLVVMEITEHERVHNMDRLARTVDSLRALGIAFALDDFGDGHSSLRLWSQIKPELVKIDKYFVRNISASSDKLKTVQALQQIAAVFETALVAEGIETADDMRVLRDMGIAYGQGYFLGRPDPVPSAGLAAPARLALADQRVAILPERSRAGRSGSFRQMTVLNAPTVSAGHRNDEVAALFHRHPEMHAVAVLEGVRPVGIINRTGFFSEYSKPYYREVWGRQSCVMNANLQPRLVEREHNVDELVGILTSDDQRYLKDGFILVDNGAYVGLGTGDQLVRSVTESRIEAARHANPLTFLPGNIPISLHIERVLAAGVPFAVCYADLDNFKPFNDKYGYWQGDEMIRLAARLALSHADPRADFVGHVGGDDFVLVFQSDNWREQCDALVREFAQAALGLFDAEARAAGGITAHDRQGHARFFPCTTLSIGVVTVRAGCVSSAEHIASQAAVVKHAAKMQGGGVAVGVCA